jgi:hypothetical protein
VELEPDEKSVLVQALHVMATNAGDIDRLPRDLVELRHALVDELSRN